VTAEPNGLNYGPEPTGADTRRVADVCVIGSGASGALVASTLRQAGLDVVVIEQGPYVDPHTTYDDLVSAAELAWVCQDNGLWAKIGYPWSTCNVGGGTVFYGGVSLRHRAADFDAEQYLGPAEIPLRWPWTPAELAPYYAEVERLLGVAGSTGDPALPPDHRYPLPPVPQSAGGRTIAEAARELGLRPFRTPLAIATRPYGDRPACTGDQPCISHQCVQGAKGDAFSVFLKPLLAGGELRLFAGLKAVRLRAGAGAAVDAVECVRVDSGRRFTIPARQVVVAGNAIQSAALLLRSVAPHWPTGLGNEHDLVGRGLCMKLSEYVSGYRRVPPGGRLIEPPMPGQAGPGPFSTAAITDYYLADDAPGGMGGLIYESGDEELFRMRPDEQILRLECLVPDEPRLDNRITFGRGQDRFGLPDLVFEYAAHPRDLARLEYVAQRAEGILRAAGCTLLKREPSLWQLGSTHLHGTCRSGTDPRTSVTDPDGRLHSVDNVTVVDGALLPFPGAVNPTLTIQTLALRAAHQLLRRGFGLQPPALAGLAPVAEPAVR
jgi:choline dehydrogenase-like flavoprotein